MKMIHTNEFEKQLGDIYYIYDNVISREDSCCEGASEETFLIKKTTDIIIFVPIDDAFYKDKNAFYMTLQHYNQLRDSYCRLPAYKTIPQLTKTDCAFIFWLESPDEIKLRPYWGQNFPFPKYRFNDDSAYLNNTSEDPEILPIVEKLLNDYSSSNDPVALQLPNSDEIITIILDTADYSEWKALSKTDNGYCLYLKPGYQVLEVGEGNTC